MSTPTPSALMNEAIDSAPSTFEDTRNAYNDENQQPPGLFISDRDIRLIKLFVRDALALPIDIRQIQHIMGTEQTNIAGLEPEDISALYSSLKNEASKWSSLELEMKKVATGLTAFSDTIKGSVEGVVSFIKQLPGYQTALGRVGEVTDEPREGQSLKDLLSKYPKIDLEPGARDRLPVLVEFTKDLVASIEGRQGTTDALKVKLTAFESALKAIEPQLALKRALCAAHGDADRIIEFNQKIDDLNKKIEESDREFSTTFKSVKFGRDIGVPLSFLLAKIYEKASDHHRDNIEILTAEKKRLETEMRATSLLTASISTLETDLQSLKIRLTDAIQTASYLESHWGVTAQYIAESRTQLSDIDNFTFLIVFVNRLTSTLSSWMKIKSQSEHLLIALSTNEQ